MVEIMSKNDGFSRCQFVKGGGLAALGATVSGSLAGSPSAQAEGGKPNGKSARGGPYNILRSNQEMPSSRGLPILCALLAHGSLLLTTSPVKASDETELAKQS